MRIKKFIKQNSLIVGLSISLVAVTMLLVVGGYRILTSITKENGQNFISQSVQLFGESLEISIEHKKDEVNNLMFDDALIANTYYQRPTSSYELHLQHFFSSFDSINDIIFLNQEDGVKAGYTYDEGEIKEVSDLSQLEMYVLAEDLADMTENFDANRTATGQTYYLENEAYMNIYQEVTDSSNQHIGYLIVPMNLQIFFEDFLDEFELSYKGYPVVKNQQMDYLMHPSTERVGQSIVELRKQDVPDADVSDLKRLEKIQLAQNSGKVEFTSYRQTSDNKEIKRRRIGAFQWITIGKERWMVMIDADYHEVTRDITEMGFIVVALFLMMIIGSIITFIAVKRTQDKEKIEKQNQLLKEIQIHKDELHAQEKKLYEMSKMETIGILTTSIVHEMNNFLTPILVNSELVLESHTPEDEEYEDLQEIVKAAQIGKAMSSNILRFSKDTKDTELYQFHTVSETFQHAIQQVAGIVPRQITLDISIGEDLGTVWVSASDIQSLVYNLVKNAFQAMNNRIGKLSISLKKITEEQLRRIYPGTIYHEDDQLQPLLFEVTDSGVGMSEETLEKACEPLFSTKDQDGEGTGLGLYVVSSIVKKYDWKMQMASQPNKGTTIRIVLFNNKKQTAAKP